MATLTHVDTACALVELGGHRLLTDPVLPAALLPADWPADRLRASYSEFAQHLAARLDSGNHARQITRTMHGFAIKLKNHIAGLNAGFICRSTFFHTADQCAIRFAQTE